METSVAVAHGWKMRQKARDGMWNNKPKYTTAWKTLWTTCVKHRGVIDAALQAHFEGYFAELIGCLERIDQRGIYKYARRTVGGMYQGRG